MYVNGYNIRDNISNAKVAVVTGSSSGIGYETSLLLARNEFVTYATMRNLKKSIDLQEIAAKERIPLKVLPLDVNDDTSVSNAIDTIVKENDRIDVLINNAGYDLFGSLEELTFLWRYKGYESCNSYYEETEKWYNSKHKLSWWKNRINAISHIDLHVTNNKFSKSKLLKVRNC